MGQQCIHTKFPNMENFHFRSRREIRTGSLCKASGVGAAVE